MANSERSWLGKWAGGRVRIGRGGKTVWSIECMRQGNAYTISLPVGGEPEGTDPATGLLKAPALVQAELALFERDPLGYKQALEERKAAAGAHTAADAPSIRLSLMTRFLDDRVTGRDGDRPITRAHAKDTLRYLGPWAKALKGRDLRKVTLREYQEIARTLTPRRHHILALRTFTHWLRRQGILTTSQDQSQDLEIPQPKKGAKKAARQVDITMEHFAKIYAALKARPVIRTHKPACNDKHYTRAQWREAIQMQKDGATVREVCEKFDISVATFFYWKGNVNKPEEMTPAQGVRDVLVLRALNGIHHTEIERLARKEYPLRRVEGRGEIVGTVSFTHEKKDGMPHTISLCEKAYLAAKRLQDAGQAPADEVVNRLVDEAADLAGVPRIDPSDLRHCFVTWSHNHGREVKPTNAGVSHETIAQIVGHTTTDTTLQYDGTRVRVMVALPLELVNDEDPECRRGLRVVG